MCSKLTVALGVFAMVAVAAGPVHAQANKCQGSKLKASGKKAGGLLSCNSKAASKGLAVDPACVTKAQTSFGNSFSKAEAKGGCQSTGDASAIESDIEAFVAGVAAALWTDNPAIDKCAGSKLKAAGKKASGKLGCISKAKSKGLPVDPACLTKAETSFGTAFGKAEAKGGCQTTGDAAAIEARVDDLVDLLSCELQASAPCNCGPGGSPTPAFIGFTTVVGTGTCGDVLDDSAATAASLDCSKLYIGGSGAGAVPPGVVPDYGTSKYRNKCCTGKRVRLVASNNGNGPGGTGSNKDCTSAGCFFGAPLPIVNPTLTGLSTCVINNVGADAVGEAMCDAGSMSINMPLSSHVFLNGDSLPKRCGPTAPNPGGSCTADPDCAPDTCNADATAIQPCPICNPSTNRCNGGPNNGNACVPGTLAATGDPYPTSHDCPPAGSALATLAIPYSLTTGLATATSVDLPHQLNVFCGFCGSMSGPTFHNPPVPCTADTDCNGLTGCPNATACSVCKQRNAGAFGVGPARTIDENGVAGGDLGTGPKSATMGGIFCIPPTFVAGGLVDSSADLPGPGAVGLPGTLSLIP